MRRAFGLLILVSIEASLVVATSQIPAAMTNQTAGTQALPANGTSEMPTPEYQELMRSAASITLKGNPSKADYGAIAQDAQSLQEIFSKLQTFWTTRSVTDAVNFAAAGEKAATDLMTAAVARDDDAITAARAALLPNCLGCHVKHAKRMPDFTLSIVTPPTPARPAAPTSSTTTGSGIGPGTGSGIALGTGGGAYRPGNGVRIPVLLEQVKPKYTVEAMRMKAQGSVLLQCVVKTDGTVGDVQLTRSLDPVFGLDAEAIAAAKQWRFNPGTKDGEPVPVAVIIELTFTLR